MSTSKASTDQVYDAFISYGRADSKDFAAKLQNQLMIAGFKVWFDSNNIPLGVDFQNQIDDGIEKADNFLFIISPHSINSPYCRKEIELAILHNKRIIPLLHVEQINRETWQQRHPNRTEAEWQDYQAKGLHSSFPNMHPAIGKINWVYFREGIDHFETALTGLRATLERHRDYVRHHTVLLNQALAWEQHQKQTRYLLIGEERQQAEAWLKQRFEEEQAPCEPTYLHCEFICQSIKNANNLMTQVFLSHAEADSTLTEQIRRLLLRQGITIWTSKTDIQTGEKFEEAIQRGIEQADTIVYLISPDALRSRYCQQEVDYALNLHKRLIPLLVQPTDLEQIPPQLRSLQFIDFTDNTTVADYRQDVDQLLKVLQEDAAYYEEHKILLSKALKWERQSRNPSILLRGYNLHRAEDWLNGAKRRSHCLPTPLQAAFIIESLQQPPVASVDVFISYSRADSDLARRLNDELQLRGRTTWFDQESIASGTDFQQEIYRGITSSNNFLFILSPRSVHSPYCADEVAYAAQLNKRFITILHRAINPAKLHPELAKVQWIDFNQREGDFYANFNQLVRTLETDREHVNSHTKWLQRALEWQAHDRSEDLLLRGGEFAIAEQWLKEAESGKKQPRPIAVQTAFIQTSRAAIDAKVKAEKRRVLILRSLLALVSTAFVGAVGIGVFAIQQKNLAELALKDQAKTLARESLSLTASESDREFDALIQAIRADQPLRRQHLVPEAETQHLIIQALQEALYRVKESNRLEGHNRDVTGISASPDGHIIATTSWDKTAKLWSQRGRLLHTLNHEDTVWETSFSPDSQIIATRSRDKTVKLWNRQGELLKTLNHNDEVWGVSFSPDSQIIATRSRDKTVKLWNRQGKLFKTLKFAHDIWEATFSPNGQWLVTLAKNGQIQRWTNQGEKRNTFQQAETWTVILSPDSQTIATRSKKKVVLWSLAGKKLSTIETKDPVSRFAFSPNGQKLVFASDKELGLWNRQNRQLQTLQQTGVNSIRFSTDGQMLLTASTDHTVKLWELNSKKDQTFQHLQTFQHDDTVQEAIFIPQTSLIMSFSGKATVKIWDLENPYSKPLPGHKNLVRRALFSPNGQTIVTRSDDGTAKLWNRNGELIATLAGHSQPSQPVRAIGFSPDSTRIATVSEDETLKLWALDGKLLFSRNLHHKVESSSLSFSPNGQRIAIGITAGNYSAVQIWSLEGKAVKTLPGDQWSPVFHPQQPMLATSSGNTVYLWDQDGQELGKLIGHKDILSRVSFSPEGNRIATASADNLVKLWTLQGQRITTLRHNDKVNDVQFSPDGQLIATAVEDNTVKLWNLEGQELQTLLGHQDRVFQVRFSLDQRTIVTASNDKTIKLWNLTGKYLRTLRQNHEIYGMDVSRDGEQVVVASEQNSAVLWSLDPGNLQENQQQVLDRLLGQACRWIDRYLKNKPEGDSDLHLCDGIHISPEPSQPST